MRKWFAVLAMLFLLCSCGAETSVEKEDQKSTQKPVETSADESLGGFTVSENDKHDALDAYGQFLNGELYGVDGDWSVLLVPASEFYYTILDMNGDGIPELALTLAFLQYWDSDSNFSGTDAISSIFTYVDGVVKLWYRGSSSYDFEILSNHALLFEYQDQNIYEYAYLELAANGNTEYYKSYYTLDLYVGDEVTRWYHVKDGESRQELPEDEWNSQLAPYLALKTDDIQWTLSPMFSSEERDQNRG